MSEQLKTRNGIVPAAPAAQQPADEGMTIDLVDLFYQLLAHWKLIVCLALVFAIAVGVYTIYFVTPMYRATSIIYVLNPESIVNLSSLQLGNALASDYIKVFSMWEVHEQVISNLNLNRTYNQMKSRLSVTNTSGTRMLDISFTSADAAEAAAVANEYAKVASEYIHETMAIDKPSIMSVALKPTNPVSPNKVRNIAMGFVAGAVLACAIIMLRFLMDDKLKTTDDIRQYCGLTTLAVVPVEDVKDDMDIKGKDSKKNQRRKT